MKIEHLNDSQQEALDEFLVDVGPDEFAEWITGTYGEDAPTAEALEDDFKAWWDDELCDLVADHIGRALTGEVEEQVRDLIQTMVTDQVYDSIGIRE
jgi:hypothetical protein